MLFNSLQHGTTDNIRTYDKYDKLNYHTTDIDTMKLQ